MIFCIHLIALFCVAYLPAIIWHGWYFPLSYTATITNSIIINTIAFLVISLFLYLYKQHSFTKIKYVYNSCLSIFALTMIMILAFRIDYSIYLLIIGFSLTFLFFLIFTYINNRYFFQNELIAYIPFGDAKNITNITNHIRWFKLSRPKLKNLPIKTIVVDLSYNLPDEWLTFITKSTLNSIEILDSNYMKEIYSGRVNLDNFHPNELGSLNPSTTYMQVKYLIDILLILLSLPIILPICLIVALLIKLEDGGNIIYTQQRVGYKNEIFNIYKFRSMSIDSEKDGAKMATKSDARITRIGKFIRKMRIDELPQFINVIKGNMSLIGPRPEQKVFVDQFAQNILFYNYRHLVKPGISGWAQVTHGYAANEDETQVKIEYDFYYIKNFSLHLDILILFKTFTTMLTGFGAR